MSFVFNARTVNPDQTPEPIPAGRYGLVVTKSNLTETKNKDGAFINLTCQVIDGPFAGRTVPHRLNVFNKNPQAVEIAMNQLSAVCHVLNVFDVAGQDGALDTYVPMLHNIPFLGDVSVENGYNAVAKVFDRNGNAPGAQGGPPQGAPQGAPPPQPPVQQQQPPAQQGGWDAPQPQQQQPQQQQPQQQQPPAQQPPAWGAPPAQQPPAQQQSGFGPAPTPGAWGR